jgi:hypothetical protein
MQRRRGGPGPSPRRLWTTKDLLSSQDTEESPRPGRPELQGGEQVGRQDAGQKHESKDPPPHESG